MITKPFSLAAIPLVMLLAGCTLAPKYQQPALPVADRYDAQPQAAGNGADLPWRNFFTDSTLQQLIGMALTNNRDLRVAALNVAVARSQVTVDRAALLPSINLTASGEAAHEPGGLYNTKTTGPLTYHEYSGGVGVSSWELDFFGRLQSLRDQALESYLATQATQRATQISLIAQVATSYLTLAADNDLLKLAQQTASSQQNSYDLTQRSVAGGVSSEQDLAQAETSVRTAQADVASYTRQVRQDVNALTLLVGEQLPASLLAGATLDRPWQFPATPAGLPSDLLTRRPDIIAAEHSLKAANASIGAARAAFFPSISLTASGGSTSATLGNLLSGGTAAWSLLPSVSLPIFNGGANEANLQIAKAQQQIELADYEKAVQSAFADVGNALAGQETYQDELKARQQDAAANQRNFNFATLRYRSGVDSYLNVLVAQRSLYSAQQSLISTHLAQVSQQITLYKALGGGWKS